MEKGVRDGKSEMKINGGPQEVEEDEEDHLGGDGESDSLLPPSRSRMSRKPEKKARRKVQWNDTNGDKLFEVLEFQPSDKSDSEDEDSDSCICTLM